MSYCSSWILAQLNWCSLSLSLRTWKMDNLTQIYTETAGSHPANQTQTSTGRWFPLLQEYTSINIWIPSVKFSTPTLDSRDTEADLASKAQLWWGTFAVPGICSSHRVCVSIHSIAAWEHLWTWKLSAAETPWGMCAIPTTLDWTGCKCGKGNTGSRAWIFHLLVSFTQVKHTLVTQRPTWCPGSVWGVGGLNHH